MIHIPRDTCIDVDRALDKEWLVTNGIGGYASSTVLGANTRRYHGLLVAALQPPVERTVMLAKIDEQIDVEGFSYFLGVNEYPAGKIYPGGFVHVEEFRLDLGIPTAVYRVAGCTIHKTVWMEYGHNTTYIRYEYVDGPSDIRIALNPFCNYRDYHGITKGNLDWNFQVETFTGGCKIVAQDGAQPLWLTTQGAAHVTPTGVWYWNFVYRREIERGFDETEDLYVPCVMRTVLHPGESFGVVASAEPPESTAPFLKGARNRERNRRLAVLQAGDVPPGADSENAADPHAPVSAVVSQLTLAADSFMVTRDVQADGVTETLPTVIAGYHWFTDWGRDTMISLPGLTLTTGKAREANKVLSAFARFMRDGLLPNNFPDIGSSPDYNTVDATLWMFKAVQEVSESLGTLDRARDLYPALSDAIAWHVQGTKYGIGVDPDDGLLRAGEEGVQLTWMDAKVDDWVVTPRTGKPVEINALWYNALRFMERLTMALGHEVAPGREETPDFAALAARVRQSFGKRFWYEEGGYLYDVVDGPSGNDPSLRPNQVLAISLGNDLLPAEQARQVLAVVRRELLTPYGLRTLAPGDPQYRPQITGDRRTRDAAYHNGTVWAWLLGPYLDAVKQVEGEEALASELARMLPALRLHLADAGLGTISEIFDGDAPHTPRGCISQAWSVAEVLRVLARSLPGVTALPGRAGP